jgi:cytochrome c
MRSRERCSWPQVKAAIGVRHLGAAFVVLALTDPAPAWADEALAKAKGCKGCHATSQKVVAPSFRDIAARYAKVPDASGTLAANIRSGVKGAWGDVPMPAQDHVSAAEAKRWLAGSWRDALDSNRGGATARACPIMRPSPPST